MQQFQSSEAYDLSLFEPHEEKKRKVQKRQEKKPRKATALQGYLRGLAILLAIGVALSVVGYMVFCKMQLSELGDQVTKATATLEEAQSEQVRLKAALEEKMATRNIESYAQALGMVRMEAYQAEYITMHSEDKVEVPEESESKNLFQRLLDQIGEWLS
ncbi:hypothetical protein [Solibaculum mannosilyticum]|uniref:Cell division protein FtsL n=1 Tax=Solibaculum mannosilyticum TaxID=2780922 RepID=A0A7I8D8F2_9FIRM|nr:hypothetical protein [Solibaculum mannosilyticum]BCI60904.1 hypothetical protein C12CBH8_15430 [Solibaculum mannosilyticum]CZT55412.1 Cell division protein FtsL [Eubacteriaceae bacterium CHKCI005]